MLTYVGSQVFAAFGIHARVAQLVGFHSDLLFEERLEYDGARTGFTELLVFHSIVGQA